MVYLLFGLVYTCASDCIVNVHVFILSYMVCVLLEGTSGGRREEELEEEKEAFYVNC